MVMTNNKGNEKSYTDYCVEVIKKWQQEKGMKTDVLHKRIIEDKERGYKLGIDAMYRYLRAGNKKTDIEFFRHASEVLGYSMDLLTQEVKSRMNNQESLITTNNANLDQLVKTFGELAKVSGLNAAEITQIKQEIQGFKSTQSHEMANLKRTQDILLEKIDELTSQIKSNKK